MKKTAPYYAMSAAFLFAAGMPSAKLLLQHVEPSMLAAFFYFGSGLGLSCVLLFQDVFLGKRAARTKLSRKDCQWFAGAILIGAVVAPLLLMAAMAVNKASTVSLLLNFEVVFTALIAWTVFKERLGPRVLLGLIAILLGGICLSWSTNLAGSWSLLLALGASFCWAVDSNLTAQISNSEPMQIARIRGLIAGTINLSVALYLGNHFPDFATICGAFLTGFIAYGMSLSLFIVAMRRLGAARAMAYFATEPFLGALLSVAVLKEPISINLLLAGVLMAIGVWLHLTEKHEDEKSEGRNLEQLSV